MARTVVDELVVLLNLDPSGFTEGQKESIVALNKLRAAANETDKEQTRINKERAKAEKEQQTQAAKAAKEKSMAAKKLSEDYAKVRNEIGRLTLAYLGVTSASSLIKEVIQSDAAVGRFADNIGMATDKMSAWQHLAPQFGSSAADITATFNGLAKTIYSFSHYTPGGPDVGRLTQLMVLGVDSKKLISNAVSIEDKIKMIGAALRALPKEEAYQKGLLAGLTPDTINMLREISGQEDKLLADVVKAGRENSIISQELQRSWVQTEQSIEDVARSAVKSASPAFQALLSVTRRIASGWKQLFDLMPGLSDAAADVALKLAGTSLTPESLESKAHIFNNALGWLIGVPHLGDKLGGSVPSAPATYSQSSSGKIGGISDEMSQIGVPHLGDKLGGISDEMSQILKDNPGLTREQVQARLLKGETYPNIRDRSLDRPYPKMNPALYALNTARSQQWAEGGNRAGNTTSSEVHIGQLTVTTQAKDGPGVAVAIDQRLQNWSLATNANNGIR